MTDIPDPDPALYREMSTPVTQTEAEANCATFFDGVSVLRRECHLADVYVILRLPIVTEDGREGVVHTTMQWGDSTLGEELCAWALGKESARREARIAEMLVTAPGHRGER